MESFDNEHFLKRLSNFISHKNLSVLEFERNCGLGRNTIHSAIKNNGSIGNDKLTKIYVKYPDLNIKWLLTGKGQMIEKTYTEEKNVSKTEESNGSYSNKDELIAHLREEIIFLRGLLKSKM